MANNLGLVEDDLVVTKRGQTLMWSILLGKHTRMPTFSEKFWQMGSVEEWSIAPNDICFSLTMTNMHSGTKNNGVEFQELGLLDSFSNSYLNLIVINYTAKNISWG